MYCMLKVMSSATRDAKHPVLVLLVHPDVPRHGDRGCVRVQLNVWCSEKFQFTHRVCMVEKLCAQQLRLCESIAREFRHAEGRS